MASDGPPLLRPSERPAALPILAVPIGDRDVVRAAFAWNLVVESVRTGASATLLAPQEGEGAPLWPDFGPGPMGAEVVSTAARDLGNLSRAALDVAVDRAADAAEGGFVLVRVPLPWLEDARALPLLRWVLLFSSPERRDLLEAYRLSKSVRSAVPEARIGLTIHGVRRIAEAEEAFGRVAGVSQRHLGRPLRSYGLLVDDLHVYRAIASRRAIGLEHPQSRAARALQDVARLLLEDARQDACLG